MAYQSAHSGLPDKMKSKKRKGAKDKEEEEELFSDPEKFSAVFDSTRQMHTLPVHTRFFRKMMTPERKKEVETERAHEQARSRQPPV